MVGELRDNWDIQYLQLFWRLQNGWEIVMWLRDCQVVGRLRGGEKLKGSGEFGEMVGYDWEIEMWLLY